MTRLSTLVWMLSIVVAAFLLYQVKYDVQRVRTEIAKVTHELGQERESLDVVAAEWAYLSRPERLRQLSKKHLSAESLMVHQVAEVEAIGFPKRLEASKELDSGYTPASVLVEGGQ
jgi:hypothetical protein